MTTRMMSGALLAFCVLVAPMAVAQSPYGQPQFNPPVNQQTYLPGPPANDKQPVSGHGHVGHVGHSQDACSSCGTNCGGACGGSRLMGSSVVGGRVFGGAPVGRGARLGLAPRIAGGGGSGWFATASGLVMGRVDDDKVWTSFDQGDVSVHLLTTRHAALDFGGGFETRFGYFWCDGMYALEGVYWGIYPDVQEANAYGAATVGGIATTNLAFNNITYDAGLGQQLLTVFYNNAERHRIQRTSEFHNIELNLLGNTCASGCYNSRLRLGWNAGVRFFRYDDGFTFSTDPNEVPFDGDPEEVHYDIEVENNLIGFQIGGRADYCFTRRVNGFATSKFGIYGNHISHRSVIGGSNGTAVVSDAASPFDGRDYDVRSNVTDVAFLGELNMGLDYQMSKCWSATAGYRAVAVSGVGHSTSQIIGDDTATDLDWLADTNNNGSLILHGAFAGLEYCY